MRRFIIINILLIVISGQHVRSQATHEFSAYAGTGLSTLSYQLSEGSRNGNVGCDFGFGYTYIQGRERVSGTGNIFREDWGIHSGLGIGVFNAKSKIHNVTARTNDLTDDEGDLFHLHTTLSGYRENQSSVLLTIPLMGLFQYDRYYGMGGFKLGVPLSSKYKSKRATLFNEAYYPRYDNWCREERFAGFGEFSGRDSQGNMKFGASMMLSFEGGVKWRLSRNIYLYSGLYFDYGLNNFAKKNQKEFVNPFNYRGGVTTFTTNSVLSVYTEKVRVMAVGVKARVAMTK